MLEIEKASMLVRYPKCEFAKKHGAVWEEVPTDRVLERLSHE